MKNFYVICEDMCSTCNGIGWIHIYHNEHDPTNPEEIPCKACNSTGVYTHNVTLAEALKYLAQERGTSENN